MDYTARERLGVLLNHEWTKEQLKEAFKVEPIPTEEQQSFFVPNGA